MADPWLSIIGIGEDGLEGLPPASRAALDAAEIVFGGPRHLALGQVQGRGRAWLVPFDVAPLLACRGRRAAVLASGDPFWHGAGGSLMPHLRREEWVSFPMPSVFSLAANALGWRLEEVLCLGLHAAPLSRLRGGLQSGQRLICTLRDGKAVEELQTYLKTNGFAQSTLTVLQALGGPNERITTLPDVSRPFEPPVVAAILAKGQGMSGATGLPDALFANDGQLTKRPVRALTLSVLAPRGGDIFWDIGTGSGSISVEFLLAAPGTTAYAVEADPGRAARARGNVESFGLSHRFHLTEAKALDVLGNLPEPSVVFVGGGASVPVLEVIWSRLADGGRLVVNAVTLETETVLYAAQTRYGGSLMRIDLAEMAALGARRGWVPARPVVQWSVQK